MLIAEFSHKGEEIEIENELWQYDYGQRIQIKGLDLPETFEVHFAWKDSEKAKVVIGSTVNGISTVDIPNVALEQRRTITAYIYLSGITEGETVNTIILSVNKRKAPENFGTPEDVDLFHHTLAATAEYQRQAKESEKQAAARSADAEAWAHGREDHPDQEQDNAKYYAEQAAASQQAAELLQQRVSDLATQAQNNIGEAQQQAIKTITEQQGISIQKIKNQTAESEDNLKNTIRAAEQIKTDLDTEVENATPIKQGLDDSNTAAIKTKVDLDKSNTIADQIKAELEVLNTTASKTKTNLDGANKIATDLTGTLENEISEGIQTKIDIQTTAEKAMSNLQTEATKQQEYIKTSIDDTLSISGKAADAAVAGKKIDSLKEDLSNKITKFYVSSHGETHLADSDNGKIMDMKVFGNSEQKKYTGYQLFALAPIDLSTGEKVSLPYTENGITVDIANDGIGYTVRGTNTLNEQVSDIYLSMSNAFDIEAGTYTRRGKIINGNSNVELISGGGSSNGGCLEYRANKVDFTFTETVKKGKSGNFVIRISPGATVNAIVYFQIEKGSEAHDFEPYVGGQPSPSPDYPQEIKSVVNPTVRVFGGTFGNKLNNKQINWLIENMNIWHDNIHFVLYDEFGINGSIRLVVCVYKNDINNYPCTFIDTDGNITTGRYQIDSINNDVKNKFIHCNMLPIADTRNVLTVVDSDSNKTVGLPNNYQTVTLPYTLNAIPVSSGGNVTIDGQQYIADYVDVERGKLIRNIDSVIFNGAENESWMLWNREDDTRWSFMYLFGVKAFSLAFYYYARSNAFTHDSNEKTDNRFWLCNPSIIHFNCLYV